MSSASYWLERRKIRKITRHEMSESLAESRAIATKFARFDSDTCTLSNDDRSYIPSMPSERLPSIKYIAKNIQ